MKKTAAWTCLALIMTARAALGASLATDKPDYEPGETVLVSGTGYPAGQTIALTADGTTNKTHLTATTVAGADGAISASLTLPLVYEEKYALVASAAGTVLARAVFDDAVTNLNRDTPNGANVSLTCGQAQPFIVAAKTSGNQPVSGVPITWSLSGGGVLSPLSSTTGADGRASTGYTAPTGAGGSFSVTATGASKSVSWTITDTCDVTPPVITPTVNGTLGTNGWYTSNVQVTWSVTDPDSAVSSQSGCSNTTLNTDTAGTTLTCTATSGGGTATQSVTIKLDKTPPSVTAASSYVAGTWTNQNVTVSYPCTDAMSGVTSSPDVTLGTEGANLTATGTCTDKAGNTATAAFTGVNIDKTKPALTAAAVSGGVPYVGGTWTNKSVTVTYACSDALSGVANSSPAETLSADGGGQSTTGTCTDKAGNANTVTFSGIGIDTVKPDVTYTLVGTLGADGWYTTGVTVKFACTDGLSGVGTLSPDAALTDGTGLTATGTCTDKAGNGASVTSAPVKIATAKPVITASAVSGGAPFVSGAWTNKDVVVTYSCSDAASGVATVSPPVTISAEGADQSVTGTCTNQAGLSASVTFNGINVDKTPPAVTADVSGATGANGWYTSAVTVKFTCADALSGKASVSPDATLNDGTNQTATGTCADKAGNTASVTSAPVKIDTTKPAITASSPFTAGTWTNQPVTVTYGCTDGGSGVASTSPADTVSAEGADQSVTGTCVDQAGNSASATFSGINIDKTPPTVTADVSGTPGANGWYVSAVTVKFGCADALSGKGTVSPDATLTDGASQTATGSCTDKAGNTASVTSAPVKIDTGKPEITASAVSGGAPYVSGAWTNKDVIVTYGCTDGGSGAASTSPSDTVSAEGAGQSVTGTCVDQAGNTASATFSGINVDKTPPTVTADVSGSLGTNGWYVTGVAVKFGCTDALSGKATVSPDATLTDGASQTATGSCTDKAGNTASVTSAPVKIDTVKPEVTASAVSNGAPYVSGGWTNKDVVVTYSCADGGSGVATNSPAETVSAEGAGQTVTGTCVDQAGNTATATFAGINLDKTPPVVAAALSGTAGANGWYVSDVTVGFTCTDALSGKATVSPDATLTDGASQTATGSCTDKAGNTASVTSAAVKIDTVKPAITASAASGGAPYVSGAWTNKDVVVTYGCADGGSGVATTTPPDTLGADGAGQTVTGTCVDQAGNASSATFTGINVDKTPPTIGQTPTLGGTLGTNGWYVTDVTVTYACGDALSGPVSDSYKATLTQEGAAQSGTAVCADKAGNTVSAPFGGINIDKTPPAVKAILSGTAGSNGWYVSDVTVSYDCSDGVSGVAGKSDSVTLGEGAAQSGTGSCTDKAGNSAGASYGPVNIDKTKPTVTASATSGGAPYVPLTWTGQDVVVSFNCADSLSGVGKVSPAQTVSTEGANQSASGTCTDKAGNSATVEFGSGIDIDKSKPLISVAAPAAGAVYQVNQKVPANYGCSDALSGVASCAGTLPTGAFLDTSSPGDKTFTVQAVDKVGQTATQTVAYGVTYNVCVLYDPTVAKKVGSTYPIKLQLCDANGNNLSNQAITLQDTGVTRVGSDVAVLGDNDNANPDYMFRYDDSLKGYIYNLSTKGLSSGTWSMAFKSAGDSKPHEVKFSLR